jgi:hypothetical protein
LTRCTWTMPSQMSTSCVGAPSWSCHCRRRGGGKVSPARL